MSSAKKTCGYYSCFYIYYYFQFTILYLKIDKSPELEFTSITVNLTFKGSYNRMDRIFGTTEI